MTKKNPQLLTGTLLRGVSNRELEQEMAGGFRFTAYRRESIKELKLQDDGYGLLDVVLRQGARIIRDTLVANVCYSKTGSDDMWLDDWSFYEGEKICEDLSNFMGPLYMHGDTCFVRDSYREEGARTLCHRMATEECMRDRVERNLRKRTAFYVEGALGTRMTSADKAKMGFRLNGTVAWGIVNAMRPNNHKKAGKYWDIASLRPYLSWLATMTSGNVVNSSRLKSAIVYTHAARAWANPYIKRVWERAQRHNKLNDLLYSLKLLDSVTASRSDAHYTARQLEGALKLTRALLLLCPYENTELGMDSLLFLVADGRIKITPRDLERCARISMWGNFGVATKIYEMPINGHVDHFAHTNLWREYRNSLNQGHEAWLEEKTLHDLGWTLLEVRRRVSDVTGIPEHHLGYFANPNSYKAHLVSEGFIQTEAFQQWAKQNFVPASAGCSLDWSELGLWFRTKTWKKEVVSLYHNRYTAASGTSNRRLYMTWSAFHRQPTEDVQRALLTPKAVTGQDIVNLDLKAYNRTIKMFEVGHHDETEMHTAAVRLSNLFGGDVKRFIDAIVKRGWVEGGEQPWHAATRIIGEQQNKESAPMILRWLAQPHETTAELFSRAVQYWHLVKTLTLKKALEYIETNISSDYELPEGALLQACRMARLSKEEAQEYARDYSDAVSSGGKTHTTIPAPRAEGRDGYVVERLSDNSPLGPLLGTRAISFCCQHPWGAARRNAWHGLNSPNGSFWIVRRLADNAIAGQCHVWRRDDVVVLDSFESRLEFKEVGDLCRELLAEAAMSIVGRLGVRAVHGGNNVPVDSAPATVTVYCEESVYSADSRSQCLIASDERKVSYVEGSAKQFEVSSLCLGLVVASGDANDNNDDEWEE